MDSLKGSKGYRYTLAGSPIFPYKPRGGQSHVPRGFSLQVDQQPLIERGRARRGARCRDVLWRGARPPLRTARRWLVFQPPSLPSAALRLRLPQTPPISRWNFLFFLRLPFALLFTLLRCASVVTQTRNTVPFPLPFHYPNIYFRSEDCRCQTTQRPRGQLGVSPLWKLHNHEIADVAHNFILLFLTNR